MRCLIVDDHPLLRSSIKAILPERSPQVQCFESSTAEEALRHMKQQRPDIVLLDLALPGMSGIEVIRAIRQQHADIPILILSASDNLHDMQRCLDEGANGFVHKTEASETILSAIAAILGGAIYIPSRLQHRASDISQRLRQVEQITTRQMDVLKLMGAGKRNKEIATALAVSEATIKVHCRDIFKVLGVNNRHQAVQEAQNLGLID